MFKSEADIDAYLTARFLNDNKNTGDVCLAEYCNVLQCDKYYESLSSEAASSTREKRLRRKGERRAYNGALLRVGENVLSRTNGECDARKERAAFRERVL